MKKETIISFDLKDIPNTQQRWKMLLLLWDSDRQPESSVKIHLFLVLFMSRKWSPGFAQADLQEVFERTEIYLKIQ